MGEHVRRVAALLRVSTTRVAQEESPAAQLAYIREEIARRAAGAEVWADTGLVYQDELTGALVLERPDVRRALADARAGRFDLLAMKSIARMGRDTLGLLAFKRHLDDLGVELAALQDGYRSCRDLELIFLVHADRAQHGRLEISENVRTNMRQQAKQGKWVAGRVPFGYRRRNRHQLELHPETAPLARLIFERRLAGDGCSQIARELNGLQVPAPSWWHFHDLLPRWEQLAATDERWAARLSERRRQLAVPPLWSARTVMQILRNPAYRGQLVYHRVWFRRRVGGQVQREIRPPDQWIPVPCPPLVTPAEWEQAQQVGRRPLSRRRRESPYLLSGLLVCGRGGGRLTGGGARAKGRFYRYYQCHNRRQHRSCDAPRLPAAALEEQLLAHLRARLARLPEVPTAAASSARTRQVVAARARLWERALADLAEERRYYRREHRRGRVAEAELDAELTRLAAAEERLRAALAQGQAAAGPGGETAGRRPLRVRVARLQAAELTAAECRRLLALALDRIQVEPDRRLVLHWRVAPRPGEGCPVARAGFACITCTSSKWKPH